MYVYAAYIYIVGRKYEYLNKIAKGDDYLYKLIFNNHCSFKYEKLKNIIHIFPKKAKEISLSIVWGSKGYFIPGDYKILKIPSDLYELDFEHFVKRFDVQDQLDNIKKQEKLLDEQKKTFSK